MSAGQCSDHDLVVSLDSSIYGVCVSPRIQPVDFYYGISTLPFCLPSGVNFPNGCIANYSDTEQDCEMQGNMWWTPATTQGECEAVKGL
jgi:hypothetical protein